LSLLAIMTVTGCRTATCSATVSITPCAAPSARHRVALLFLDLDSFKTSTTHSPRAGTSCSAGCRATQLDGPGRGHSQPAGCDEFTIVLETARDDDRRTSPPRSSSSPAGRIRYVARLFVSAASDRALSADAPASTPADARRCGHVPAKASGRNNFQFYTKEPTPGP